MPHRMVHQGQPLEPVPMLVFLLATVADHVLQGSVSQQPCHQGRVTALSELLQGKGMPESMGVKLHGRPVVDPGMLGHFPKESVNVLS